MVTLIEAVASAEAEVSERMVQEAVEGKKP